MRISVAVSLFDKIDQRRCGRIIVGVIDNCQHMVFMELFHTTGDSYRGQCVKQVLRDLNTRVLYQTDSRCRIRIVEVAVKCQTARADPLSVHTHRERRVFAVCGNCRYVRIR